MSDPPTDRHSHHGLLLWVGRRLTSPYVPVAAVLVALALTALAVKNGLDVDDYYHRAVMTGSARFSGYLGGPQDMFRFMPCDPERTRSLMDIGFVPWWTYPRVKAEFLQFLTVQTHVLDYRLWPDRPDLMHVHSLAWFALLVFLAATFYRRYLGATWMAGAAALLFAVEDAHGTPVGWICNRNILLAASFGIACLIAHDVWRRSGRKSALLAAVLLWTCSLCSKEAGIATCAYLGAYALWLDRASPSGGDKCLHSSTIKKQGSCTGNHAFVSKHGLVRRLLTLVPYGLVLVLWRVVRDMLGYGVQDLGLYVDPIADPARFVLALVERFPILLLGQWGFPASDLSVVLVKILGSPMWWWALSFLSVLFILFWPLLRRDRLARFFATGMLLATIPICATFPSDRLLMFVGLGAFGLLVRFWWFVFAADAPRPRSVLWRVAAVPIALLFVLLHCVLAPPLLALRATAPTGPRWYVERFYIRLPFDEKIENQDLIVVNAPSAMHANYCLLLCEFEGRPSPRAIRALGPGLLPMTIRRPDERTLEIAPSDGYLGFFLDRLFRNEDHALHLREKVQLRGMTAEVISLTGDGRPSVVSFRFDRPLEDPQLRWIQWDGDRFTPFTPPAVGGELEIRPKWPSIEEVFSSRE